MKNMLRLSLFALVLPIAISISSLNAANPSTPFTPADRVLDPNCLPTDSNCYVSNTTVNSLNILGQAPVVIGPELITNGSFATGTEGWVLDCGTYTQGAVRVTYVQCLYPNFYQDFKDTFGKTYKITFTVSGLAGDNLVISNNSSFEQLYTANGTYSAFYVSDTPNGQTNILYFDFESYKPNATFTIDNVSVKETTDLAISLSVKDFDGSSLVSFGGTLRNNLAIGKNALSSNVLGDDNLAIGKNALKSNTTGYYNTASGMYSLLYNTTGSLNTANGYNSLFSNTTGNSNTASGMYSLSSNTTGSGNLVLGYQAASSQTLGDHNILLGYNNNLASTTGSNQLNIGNLIYGTSLGINGTASAGNIGIGNSAPAYKLHVGNSSLSGVVSRFENSTGYCDINPTTTSLTCTSDERLKKNISPIASSSTSTLERLTNLNPVMYNWLTEDNASSSHAGFIAQEVQPLFPDLVSEDENGTLSVAYGGFVVYVVQALKEISSSFNEFRDSLAKLVHTDRVETKTLCVGEEGNQTCISKSQLDSLLQQTNTNINTFTPTSASDPAEAPITTTTEEIAATSTEVSVTPVSAEVVDIPVIIENNITTQNEN